jgi:hypothetical protein
MELARKINKASQTIQQISILIYSIPFYSEATSLDQKDVMFAKYQVPIQLANEKSGGRNCMKRQK